MSNDDHFRTQARAKHERICAYHGTPGKLIYLNLVSSQDGPLGYYDQDFQAVERFVDAHIIVIRGVLQRAAPNAYQQAFEYFLHDLRIDLEQGES
jgi:hypothetical protein